MKNGPTKVEKSEQKISNDRLITNLSWIMPQMNINMSVTKELAEYIVPTFPPVKPKPLLSEVSQIWKNDHQILHEAKKSMNINELCK